MALPIDSPPRRRDPLKLAACLALWSNDHDLSDEEQCLLKDASIELRAWHDHKFRKDDDK